jgi:hypothetical protein
VALKSKETLFEVRQRGEIVRGEDFSLDGREINFDLVEPTGDRSWIFPRDPNLVEKAIPILDLYERVWPARKNGF